VCHGKFHGILPKEYSITFYEVPWGLYKEMSTNTECHSDIVTYKANILNKVWTLLYIMIKYIIHSLIYIKKFLSKQSTKHFTNVANYVQIHTLSRTRNELNCQGQRTEIFLRVLLQQPKLLMPFSQNLSAIKKKNLITHKNKFPGLDPRPGGKTVGAL
jgi:hypothetical protein